MHKLNPSTYEEELRSYSFLSSWKTEEDKREKVFNLPRIREMIRETHKLYENQSVTEHYNKGYERGSMCPPCPWGWERRELCRKYNKRCEVSELVADHLEAGNISSVPTERTQSPEEALQFSIWSPYSTFNMSLLRFGWKPNYI